LHETIYKALHKLLFKHIDNSGLLLFRVVFGFLIALEGFGAIATGWVKKTLIDPQFTFNFIGFEFLQPLEGNGMYFYFMCLGILGVGVMLGYKYRLSMFCFAVMWSGVYLMQKSSYNNHYYLMLLLSWLMVFLPANKWFSIDVRQKPSIASRSMPRWVILVLILQVWIVYTYAAIAKIYPAWLDGTVTGLFMTSKKDYWLIGSFLQQQWVHYGIAYVGILFDALIVPLLLYKRTRFIAFCLSIVFHVFNAVVFQIGIFPFMSLAFAFFFFFSKNLQQRFFPKKEHYDLGEVKVPPYSKIISGILCLYFIIQIALPLRHLGIKDDVLWTEEGHRLSWRMMLRSKTGYTTMYTLDKKTQEKSKYNIKEMLTKKQQRTVGTKPDVIWQLAQRIKQIQAAKGIDVAVFADTKVSVNGGPYARLINDTIDLAQEKWTPLNHHFWILPSPKMQHTPAEKY
jgi:vitamin K-dependent gamma-carboxylase